MPNTLPRSPSLRLQLLIQRIRRQRFYRQLSGTLFVAFFIPFLLILIDYSFEVAPSFRQAGLIAWLVVMVFLGWRLWRGYRRTIPLEQLSTAVEENFPRQTAVVDLSKSPSLSLEELVRDLDQRTVKLNLQTHFPTGTALASLLASALLVLAMLLPAALAPKGKEYLRRFVLPWSASQPTILCRIIVTSGDPALKRGESITLTAYAEAIKPNSDLPDSAELVMIGSDGREERLAMMSDEGNVWRGRKENVESSFRYRVESGGATSETYRVRVVEPIVLTEAKTNIVLPEYARRPGHQPTPIQGLGELSVLEQSELEIELHFAPLPKRATLTFTAERQGDERPRDELSTLSLDEEGRTRIRLKANRNGTLKWAAEGERQVISDFPPQALRVVVDSPPKFLRVVGVTDRPRDIRPDEHLLVEATVSDDIGINRVVLEWRINDGPVESIPFTGKGIPGTHLDAKWLHLFRNRVKHGDILYCRLVTTDNRNVPGASLSPQIVYFPSQNIWSEFHINSSAEPLAEQDILRRQREIEISLKGIRDELKTEANAATKLRQDRQRMLDGDQKELAGRLPENLRYLTNQLDLLSREVSITPELRSLAEAISSLGQRELSEAETAASKGRDEGKVEERIKRYQTCEAALTQSLVRVETLFKHNARLARDRLDRIKLEYLFEEQAELARRTQQTPNPEIESLPRDQQALIDQLKKLLQQSEAIRNSVESARQARARMMAEQVDRLAQEWRALNEAMKKSDRRALETRLVELRGAQEQLLRQAKELSERTDAATRAAQASPLNLDSLTRAQEALAQGHLDEAIKEQEKARQELHRLDFDLDKGASNSLDPREAARQLSRLQANTKQYLVRETMINPLAQVTPVVRDTLNKNQEAIIRAIEELRTASPETETFKKKALYDSRLSGEALMKGDDKASEKYMDSTHQLLEKLAEKLPGLDARLRQAKLEVNVLRQKQEDLRHATDRVLEKVAGKNADDPVLQRDLIKQLGDLALLQESLAEQVERMDLPDQERRQKRTARILQLAAVDLTNARPLDLSATQLAARRELERLEQSLNGMTPADEKVVELLHRQKVLAEGAANSPDDVRRKELTRRQGDLVKEIEKLLCPEAAAIQGEAVEAARFAEAALRRPDSKLAEIARLTREAELKLQQLDRQLQGAETAKEAATRLARRQRDLANAEAKRPETAVAEGRRKALQTAEELRNLRTGSNFQQIQKQALEALNRASQTIDAKANLKAQEEAAQTLEHLAKQLQPMVDKALIEVIEEIEKLQNQLVSEVSRGEKLPPEKLIERTNRQRELARRLANLSCPKNSEIQREALRAMNKAAESLVRPGSENAGVTLKVTEHLKSLIAALQHDQVRQAQARYSQLPTRQQAEEARQLAREQARLRDEAMKVAHDLAKENLRTDNPVAELVKRQQELARMSEELAQRPDEKQAVIQAARDGSLCSKQALQNVQLGLLGEAKQAGERVVQLLEKLDPQLARQQRELNAKFDELAVDPVHARLQQKAQAIYLESQLKNLHEALQKVLTDRGMEANQKLPRAVEWLQKAEVAYRRGESTQATHSREQAIESLESLSSGIRATLLKENRIPSLMGEALLAAQEQMLVATQRLKQNQHMDAARFMERAAQSIREGMKHLSDRIPSVPTQLNSAHPLSGK
jgi:membrane-associated phospholipid phosphatase/uncharacterized phage infection (PIP) family protein YhgE